MFWFGLVSRHIKHCDYSMPNPLYTYIKYIICFGWVLWHINHCKLFNANILNTYILNVYDLVWLDLVWFYGISTIVGYLMPNPLYTYIYIQHIRFGLVGFYDISTIVGYLRLNPLYTYILNLSSSLRDFLPSLNLLCHLKTDSWFMQDGWKAVWSIP